MGKEYHYDVSSVYPHVLSKTEININLLKELYPQTMEGFEEKILDEVLKRLDKEVELVINKKVGQFYLGLQHAKLIVKDMKK